MMNEREKAICSRVRSFRESIKWSQPDFAVELGISRDKLASIEYHRSPLRYSVAIAMCRAFDLSALWLATGSGQTLGYGPLIWTHEERTRFRETDPLSRVYDFFPALFRARHTGGPIPFKATPGFDPKDFLIQEVLIWFRTEKFRTPVEAEAFALDVNDFAKRLLRSYQHSGNAVRSFKASRAGRSGGKLPEHNSQEGLDMYCDVSDNESVQTPIESLDDLMNKVREKTAIRGARAALARELNVSRQAVDQWLSGETSPAAEITIRLVNWVNQPNRKQNTLGSASNTTKGKTQVRSSTVYEKAKSSPPKR